MSLDANARAAALELERSFQREDEGAPEIETEDGQPAPDPAPAGGEPVPDPRPGLEDLEKLAGERRSKRLEREQTEQDRRDAAAWRAMQAGQQKPPTAEALTPDAIREAFSRMPPDARTAVLRTLSREVISPDVAALERRYREDLSAVEKKAEDARVAAESAQKLAAFEVEKRENEKAYIGHTSDETRFPQLSRLSPQDRVQLAYEIYAKYQEYDPGMEVDDDFLALQSERYLAARAPAAQNPPGRAPGSSKPPTETAGQRDAGDEMPGTLNDLAAASTLAPQTFEERRKAAVALERKFRRESR